MEYGVDARIWGTHDEEEYINLMAYRIRLEPGDKIRTADGREGIVIDNNFKEDCITAVFVVVHRGIAIGHEYDVVPYPCISHELYGRLWTEKDAELTRKTYEKYSKGQKGKRDCSKCKDSLKCASSNSNMDKLLKNIDDKEFHKC